MGILLMNAGRKINDSLFLPTAWIMHFSKGRQTTNTQIIAVVARLFEILSQCIKAAKDAMASRL